MNDKYKLTPLNSNASVVVDFEKCGADYNDSEEYTDNQYIRRINLDISKYDSRPANTVAIPFYMENVQPLLDIMKTGVVSAHFLFPSGHSTLLDGKGVEATVPMYGLIRTLDGVEFTQLEGVLDLENGLYVLARLGLGTGWDNSTQEFYSRINFTIKIISRS